MSKSKARFLHAYSQHPTDWNVATRIGLARFGDRVFGSKTSIEVN